MPNKSYHHSTMQVIATLWLLLCSAAFLAYSVANPIAEWDMLAYAASADAIDGTPPELIHSRAYSALKARVTAEEYEAITSSNHYRQVMYEDVAAFNEQLPYYSIRVTFNALLAKLNKLGLDFFDAGHWVTASAFVFTMLMLWGSLNDRIHPVLQLIFPLMFFKYSMDLEVVRQVLADSLSSLWVVFICVAYLRQSKLLLPLIALSVFIRVDLIVFAGLLLLLMLVTSERRKYFSLFVCGAFLLAFFLLVQHWAGSYGWHTLFYFAIITDMIATHPSQYGEIGFTFAEYLDSLIDPSRWISPMYAITAICSAFCLYVWQSANLGEHNRRVCRISGVCLVYIIVHYLIFPQMYLRFFVGQNLMIFSGFAMLCTHYWHVYGSDRRSDRSSVGERVSNERLSDERTITIEAFESRKPKLQ